MSKFDVKHKLLEKVSFYFVVVDFWGGVFVGDVNWGCLIWERWIGVWCTAKSSNNI